MTSMSIIGILNKSYKSIDRNIEIRGQYPYIIVISEIDFLLC